MDILNNNILCNPFRFIFSFGIYIFFGFVIFINKWFIHSNCGFPHEFH